MLKKKSPSSDWRWRRGWGAGAKKQNQINCKLETRLEHLVYWEKFIMKTATAYFYNLQDNNLIHKMNWFSLLKYKYFFKKFMWYIIFAIQRNPTSLNSPVACFISDIFNLFTKGNQVFNHIWVFAYSCNLSEAVSTWLEPGQV